MAAMRAVLRVRSALKAADRSLPWTSAQARSDETRTENSVVLVIQEFLFSRKAAEEIGRFSSRIAIANPVGRSRYCPDRQTLRSCNCIHNRCPRSKGAAFERNA